MAALDWRHTGRFAAAAFLMDFASGMLLVPLPYLALKLGADSMQLGVLGAARGCTYMVACFLVALVVDRWNRKAPIACGATVAAAAMVVMGLAREPWHLYAFIMLWAAALAFFWPSVLAWIGDSHPAPHLARATAVVNVSWSIGIMAGGVAGGCLFQAAPVVVGRLLGAGGAGAGGVQRTAWVLSFAASAVPAVLAAGVLLVGVPRGRAAPVPPTAASPRPGSRRGLIAAWIGNIGTCSLLGVLENVFPKLGETPELGIKAGLFGVLMASLALGRTFVFAAGLGRGAWVRDWRVVGVLQLAAAALIASVAATSAFWWLLIVFAGVGVAAGAAYYMALYRSLEGEGSRGFKSGLHEASLLGGVLLGALGGGYVGKVWHMRAPYPTLGVLCVLLLAGQVALNTWSDRAGARG